MSAAEVRELALAARRAGRALAALDGGARRKLLERAAEALTAPAAREQILGANAEDLAAARALAQRGELEAPLLKRLALDGVRLDGLCDGLRQLAARPELVGRRDVHRELDHGLVLERVACPLGLLGAVFESRPDAVPQIAGLALKSGNAVLLKGGREAAHSLRALVGALRGALAAEGLDPAALALLEDRAQVDAMLALDGVIDLVVARGGAPFVRHVRAHTRIPVLSHADGLCHLVLHPPLDAEMAAAIALDAKTSYPAACNSIETLLWVPGAEAALEACVAALAAAGVELRGCAQTRALHPGLFAAGDSDWSTEYGAPVLALRRVADLGAALAHIERYGSRHTEAIVTGDRSAAERFLAEVDAAGVFHNASTRFADGYRYGLGAEVGISTEKLHARGPVGVEGLLSYRWLLRGEGQVSSAYGPGKRPFSHRDL